MMHAKYLTSLIAIVLLWESCKKAELPPSSFDDPVFRVTYFGDTTGDQTVTAGLDDVYLFTDFEESDFVVCSGSFSDVKCPDGDCPGSLTFRFRSLATGNFAPDTVFYSGLHSYEGAGGGAADTVFLATFTVVPNSGYDTYSWDIDSVFAGQGASLVREFQDNAPQTVRLAAQKQSGLKSTVFRTVSLTNPGASFPVAGIDIQSDSAVYTLTAEASGTPVDQYIWNTADTNQVLLQNALLPAYSVIVQDVFGNRAQARFEQLTPGDIPVHTAGFTYDVQQIVIPPQFGDVSIQWVDPQGVVWRSDTGIQSSDAVFQVLESKPYEVNERSQKTYKMRVQFDCLLFNAAGDSRAFSGAGTIAVAHP